MVCFWCSEVWVNTCSSSKMWICSNESEPLERRNDWMRIVFTHSSCFYVHIHCLIGKWDEILFRLNIFCYTLWIVFFASQFAYLLSGRPRHITSQFYARKEAFPCTKFPILSRFSRSTEKQEEENCEYLHSSRNNSPLESFHII